jgi:hypothetical protein
MNIAVCTLFEGDYHLGAGALVNSLHASGFRGTLWAGTRGALPPWAAGAVQDKPGIQRLAIAADFCIAFVQLQTEVHFAYYKPELLQRVLSEFAPEADAAIYLDPDIVLKCPWEIFPRWVEDGVALVEDLNPNLPPRHPLRIAWLHVLAEHSLTPRRELGRYYNSGFVGVPRTQLAFLAEWQRTMAMIRECLGAHHHIKFGCATDVFHSTDQDALNLALMLTDTPLNTAGPEAMDFAVGGHYLSHAVGTPKPWQGGFIRKSLRGYPPSTAAKEFFNHTRQPISVFPAGKLKRLTLALKLAALVGRFYRRS